MHAIESLILLLGAATLLAHLARTLKVPYPSVPGPRRAGDRLRAGLARPQGSPRGNLPSLLAAAPELRGLLFLAARTSHSPPADSAARHRPCALHHGGNRASGSLPDRYAVCRGVRAGGDPRTHRPGRRSGRL